MMLVVGMFERGLVLKRVLERSLKGCSTDGYELQCDFLDFWWIG